jgi:hypothetical protein
MPSMPLHACLTTRHPALPSRCSPLRAMPAKAQEPRAPWPFPTQVRSSMPCLPSQSIAFLGSRCLPCWAMPIQPSARRANRRLSAAMTRLPSFPCQSSTSRSSRCLPRQSHSVAIRAFPFLTCRAFPFVGLPFLACRSMPRACVARPYLPKPAKADPGGALRNLAQPLLSRPSLPVHDSPSVSLPVPYRRWEASAAQPLHTGPSGGLPVIAISHGRVAARGARCALLRNSPPHFTGLHEYRL